MASMNEEQINTGIEVPLVSESEPIDSDVSKAPFTFLSPDASEQANNPGDNPKTRGMFSFLLPAFLVILIIVLSALIRQEIDRMLLSEKLIEKRFEIALIAEQTDNLTEEAGDWESAYNRYLNTILASIEMLDKIDMTYAAVFDENLQNMSARNPSYEGSPFEPTAYAEFLDNVYQNEMGDLILDFTPPGSQMRSMFLHYRWVPSSIENDHRLLLVTAISKFSVNTRISVWMQITTIVLVILAFVMTLYVWQKQLPKYATKIPQRTLRQKAEELEKRIASGEKVSIEKGHFLQQMAYKIQSSLDTITEQSAVVQQSCAETSAAYKAGKRISETATPLIEVLDDMQSIRKIEQAALALDIAPFSLKTALQEITDTVAGQIEEKQIQFVTNMEQAPDLLLLGDQAHLNQILGNLLNNAVKYSAVGGQVRFRVDSKIKPEPNAIQFTFTIVDEGAGIPEAQLNKMYDIFNQTNAAAEPNFKEVGVGLSISYILANLMGGTLSVQSQQGKGSVFSFTVTLSQAQ